MFTKYQALFQHSLSKITAPHKHLLPTRTCRSPGTSRIITNATGKSRKMLTMYMCSLLSLFPVLRTGILSLQIRE